MRAPALYTRRRALGAAGLVLAGALGLAGCSGTGDDSDPHATQGYAWDTLVKDYPVHLKLYSDTNVMWRFDHQINLYGDADWDDKNHLEHYITRYRSEPGRGDVSIEVEYVDPFELLGMAQAGLAGADGVLGLSDCVAAGCSSGALDGGQSRMQVRDMTYNFADQCCIVRAAGGDAELPPAPTVDGEDSADGHYTRFRQLAEFDGAIALADPASSVESIMALAMMESAQLYRPGPDGGAGAYADGLTGKLVTFPSQDAAMDAVAAGECRIGFALESSLARRFTQVEKLYRPGEAGSMTTYAAAPTAGSAEPAVMRDFFEYITKLSD